MPNLKTYKISSLILASVAVGLAMLSKGPIGLAIPALAILPHIFLTSNYKAIFTWKVLLIPLIIIVVLSPMLVGLYQQFGMQGIRFYFGNKVLDELQGENVWQNDATKFYFLHNIVWAFSFLILSF
ncbi:MAG: hypothetical protein R2777_00455 [Chitinophagales bacterium]